MIPARLAVTLVLVAPLMGGCGTMMNVAYFNPSEGGERIYGGVRTDLIAAQMCLDDSAKGDITADKARSVGAFFLCLADVPLSLIGDTATLPLTVFDTLKPRDPTPVSRTGEFWEPLPDSSTSAQSPALTMPR